jgi:hypothetical protein
MLKLKRPEKPDKLNRRDKPERPKRPDQPEKPEKCKNSTTPHFWASHITRGLHNHKEGCYNDFDHNVFFAGGLEIWETLH